LAATRAHRRPNEWATPACCSRDRLGPPRPTCLGPTVRTTSRKGSCTPGVLEEYSGVLKEYCRYDIKEGSALFDIFDALINGPIPTPPYRLPAARLVMTHRSAAHRSALRIAHFQRAIFAIRRPIPTRFCVLLEPPCALLEYSLTPLAHSLSTLRTVAPQASSDTANGSTLTALQGVLSL
jgi:hypothetical protein